MSKVNKVFWSVKVEMQIIPHSPRPPPLPNHKSYKSSPTLPDPPPLPNHKSSPTLPNSPSQIINHPPLFPTPLPSQIINHKIYLQVRPSMFPSNPSAPAHDHVTSRGSTSAIRAPGPWPDDQPSSDRAPPIGTPVDDVVSLAHPSQPCATSNRRDNETEIAQ